MVSDAIRGANIKWLNEAGFKVAEGLPTVRSSKPPRLRPTHEIVARLLALDAVFTWVAALEAAVPGKALKSSAKELGLAKWLTDREKAIFKKERPEANGDHADTIGWRLENIWALAWVLGFRKAPPCDGQMMDRKVQIAIRKALLNGLPAAFGSGNPADLPKPRPLNQVVALEDRYYCCHNAVRSAQLGGRTVPKGFDPIVNGGVIHEQRVALTWCLSPKVKWDDTDVST